MRCFISIDVDTSLLSKISELIGEIQTLNLDIKLVELENLHFTVNFIGDVNENEINDIVRSLDFLKNEHQFKIEICGIGYFGRKNRIKTVWLGVKRGEDNLTRFLHHVNDNVKFGEKNNTPHLTIARMKTNRNAEKLIKYINDNRNVNIGEMHVKSVKLKSSVLLPSGPIYSDLSVFELNE